MTDAATPGLVCEVARVASAPTRSEMASQVGAVEMSAAAKLPPETEQQLHRAVAGLLAAIIGPCGQTNGAGVFWLTVELREPNKWARMERAGRGAAAGLADLMFVYQGRYFGIELKRPKVGRLSQAQKDMIRSLKLAGSEVAVCQSCKEVLSTLNLWSIPHRTVQFAGTA